MNEMIYGVDLGWLTQLEAMGYRWLNEQGEKADAFAALKELGVNAVRLRVFVNPPKDARWMKRGVEPVMLGFCDKESVLAVSRRIKANGMKLMITLHYSDHFADPEIQDIPEEWAQDDEEALTKRVYAHTKDVMELLAENGVSPEWVQVGNEVNNGILWPKGHLQTAPEALVRFLNAGCDAVKEISPETTVITHLASVCNEDLCEPFLKNFFQNGGKTDMLGFSYYPYWEKFESSKDLLAGYLKRYAEEYRKPVMVVEVGGRDDEEEKSYHVVRDVIGAMREMTGQKELGVFYWEPEATSEILPDKYPLSAAKLVGEKTLQYNKTLQAYRDDR